MTNSRVAGLIHKTGNHFFLIMNRLQNIMMKMATQNTNDAYYSAANFLYPGSADLRSLLSGSPICTGGNITHFTANKIHFTSNKVHFISHKVHFIGNKVHFIGHKVHFIRNEIHFISYETYLSGAGVYITKGRSRTLYNNSLLTPWYSR
jgi:hypothetical protein